MSQEEQAKKSLPENAYRELKPGEEYQPVMSPKMNFPEVTWWSIFMGLLMAVIFSAAAALLRLNIGQVFLSELRILFIDFCLVFFSVFCSFV